MKRVSAIFLIFIAWSALFLLYGKDLQLKNSSGVQENSNAEIKTYSGSHTAYSMLPDAYGDLENAKSPVASNGKIYGGIVSHHFLLAPEIAGFFAGLKEQEVDNVVIIGPNHFSAGESNILVSEYPYNTPWGMLEPNSEIIENLVKDSLASNEEIPFEKEHSISTLAGFTKFYLPHAKIIPIILKRKTSNQEAERLARALNEILPEKTVVIASVDFSHHLDQVGADFHDAVSISSIKSFDYGRLDQLEIDSPPSIYTLLKYLESRGSQKMAYKNTNSADFLGRPGAQDITSYVFGYFTKGQGEKENMVSLLSFGDAIFDRDVKRIISQGKDPFEKIKGIDGNFLKGTDFISINLEGPITDSGNCREKIVSFKFPPETAKLLWKNGINLVNLANNHSNDCFAEGRKDTQKYLENFNIDYFGASDEAAGSYTVKKAGDKRIAFVGIDETLKDSGMEIFYDLVKNLKGKNNYVVVNVHWGVEYAKNPSGRQTEIAHRLIDNGADIIIGHHPHVIEPVEIYKNKTIFYSLGNFIFDQLPEETRSGIGIGSIMEGEKTKFFIFPYKIKNDQPELLPYSEAAEFCNKFLGGTKTSQPCYLEN